MEPHFSRYPWYGITSGPDIQQGDIFNECRVWDPESTTFFDEEKPVFTFAKQDVIVLTQSCDLVPGQRKTDHVLICALWKLAAFPPNHHLATPKGLEEVRRGNIPGFHMLAPCEQKEFSPDIRLVDFRRTWSLPLAYVQQQAQKLHLRLLPPYREHLSQAFARYFMRIGLPTDIPPFK